MKFLIQVSLIISLSVGLAACSSASSYEFPIPLDRCAYIEEQMHACSEKLMKPEDEKKTWNCKLKDPHYEMLEQQCRHHKP